MKAMVSFTIGVLGEQSPEFTVLPVINGLSLTQMISDFERQHGYHPAGGYQGIIPQRFEYGPLEKYFFGEYAMDSYWAEIGGIYILACECGEAGRWPLQCVVKIEGDSVVWKDFQQPHRPGRSYSGFGPFSFDTLQYRDELVELARKLA